MAVNELQRIRMANHAYMYAKERSKAYQDAKAYLDKVREQYGTINPSMIEELIR